MTMYCQSPTCDFKYEQDITSATVCYCPQCGGTSFANFIVSCPHCGKKISAETLNQSIPIDDGILYEIKKLAPS